ncbi:MAG: YopX family protein [Candidatus Helarchaeota archaeon]
MRIDQLKFRAWDEKGKRMLFVNGFLFGMNYVELWDINSESLIWNESDKTGKFHLPSNQIELLQYIGLKDKRDKDIYEGDILDYCDSGKIYIVQWDDENCEFNCGDKYDKPLVKGNESGLEIIGNIYENSELINLK